MKFGVALEDRLSNRPGPAARLKLAHGLTNALVLLEGIQQHNGSLQDDVGGELAETSEAFGLNTGMADAQVVNSGSST